jgi:hypothetical protein
MRCIEGAQPPSEANAWPIDPKPRAAPSDPDAGEVDVPDFELPIPEPK